MKASKVVFLVFLILISLSVVNTQPVKSQLHGPTIHIRDDGSVEGTDKIQRVGNVYTFTDNIYFSIVVEKDNIVIDGAGYTLQGGGSGMGINMTCRNNVTIQNLKVKTFSIGIFVGGYPNTNNTIVGNIVTENVLKGYYDIAGGIWLDGFSNNVTGNYIINNRNGIIFVDRCSNDNISRNYIANNEVGIYIQKSPFGGSASNNAIYHNSFIVNTKQVYDDYWEHIFAVKISVNVWDDDYPSGGNYWSDYAGVDVVTGPYQNLAGSDGIGDASYMIDVDNKDRYPLMANLIPPLETTPPTISVTSPQNKVYHVNNVYLTFNIDEPTLWIGYSLDGQANVTVAETSILSGLSDGKHSLKVYAEDMFENIGTSETTYFIVDTSFPAISILSPENKTYTITDIPITLKVTEPTSWICYSLDNQANVTITGNTTVAGLPNGLHSLTVYANDTAGNIGASETVYFTVALPSEPFPTTWIATAIGIIAIGAVAFLVYFRKIRKTHGKANQVKEATNNTS